MALALLDIIIGASESRAGLGPVVSILPLALCLHLLLCFGHFIVHIYFVSVGDGPERNEARDGY